MKITKSLVALFTVFILVISILQLFYYSSCIIVTKSQDENALLKESNSETIKLNDNYVSTRGSNRADFTPWGISSFNHLDLDNPNKKTIYPGLKPYIFRFIIDDFDRFSNVTSVSIMILNEDQSYNWSRSSRASLGVGIEQNYNRSGQYSSGYYLVSPTLGYLDFNITYPWPKTTQRSIHVWKVEIEVNNTQKFYENASFDYTVVSRLKFIGLLTVTGEHQGLLNSNSWVRHNENLTWSGLKLIYDTETSIVPPHDQAQIILTDELKNIWYDQALYGENMQIYTQSGPETNLLINYILDIAGPGKEYLESIINFNLRVDGDGINFYNPVPHPSNWQTNIKVNCGVNVSDNLTSGINVDSIEFRFSKNNGKTWFEWYKPANKDINENDIYFTTDIEFQEGYNNLIQWRGKDLVGNGYSYSAAYNIKIDKSPLIFKNPKPSPGVLQYSEILNCSVEIIDDISGVDLTTINYAIKLDGDKNWSEWKLPELANQDDLNHVLIFNTITFRYGEYNYIKYRAKDLAGNGYYESEAFQVNTSHKIPKIYLISPTPGQLVNETQPTFKWANSYKMVQPVTFTIYYWIESDPTNKAVGITTETEFVPDKALKFGETYFWEVLPETENDKGVSESGIWTFTVNTLANIHPWVEFDAVAVPTDEVRMTTKETKIVEILIYNKGNQYDNYSLALIAESPWNDTIEFTDHIYIPANNSNSTYLILTTPKDVKFRIYQIKIKISSTRSYLINKTLDKNIILNIEVVKEQEKFELPIETIILIFVLIIIVFVILLIIYTVISRAKLKKFETDLLHAGNVPEKTKEVKDKDVVIEYQPERKKVVDRTSQDINVDKDKFRGKP